MNDTTTYLIDKCGYVVHKWVGKYRPGLSVYLLPNGKLLKTGVDKNSPFKSTGGGWIEIQNWDGSIEWSYKLSTETECQHHDVKYMPNGNILAIVYENKTLDEVQIAGRDPKSFNKYFWSEKITELRPIGIDSAEIVWEWKVWDHLIQDFDNERANYGKVELHPELIDANFGDKSQIRDWHHMNSVDYNPKYDQILLSSRHFNEIWVIDHSTTTLEAASHEGGKYGKGGDLLYRWGNPQTYRYGTVEDEQLFHQHDAHWITEGFSYAGSIMIFNNLHGPTGNQYSSVDIIKPPIDSEGNYNNELPYLPATTEWSYTAPNPTDFFAINISGAQMLKSGNVIICNGAKGLFFELDTAKTIVWKYMNPVGIGGILTQGIDPKLSNNVFRCTFYPEDYSAFEGKDLSSKGIIESNNSNSDVCTLFTSIIDNNNNVTNLYPNPSDEQITIETEYLSYTIEIIDIHGERLLTVKNTNTISTKELSNGMYFICLFSESGNVTTKKFIIRR
ncbi:MAG: aryl-sulfate sulfotransferase [bacterium]